MSEIEKMYENAGLLYCNKCRHDSELDCLYMCESKYPPFTAEKQFELIKWLSHWGIQIGSNKEKTLFEIRIAMKYIISSDNDFTNCLANIIIQLWQDLTEEEKETVHGILGT